MIRLVLLSREFENQSCRLDDGHHRVGRDRRNDIVILDNSVSGEHCELLVYGGELIVRERGSRNGTYVDGVRIKAQSGVKPGQTISLGQVEIRVELESHPDGSATSFTAMDDYRRIRHQAAQPSVHATVLPIVFAPKTPGRASIEGSTDLAPEQPETR
jgi:pSer/pThr/pTyr-binding forkhead associated (FHA) protein